MVVTYRVSWLSYLLVRPFLHVDLYALPNILAGRRLVPELIQSRATPQNLAEAVEFYLEHPDKVKAVRSALGEIHHSLRQHADERAAEAVLKLLRPRQSAATSAVAVPN